ncbi:putative cation/calcium exchanger 4-like [Capsicum annuum]|nr:putative cation/calcium exchanger 4-like [Capsicum annuum]
MDSTSSLRFAPPNGICLDSGLRWKEIVCFTLPLGFELETSWLTFYESAVDGRVPVPMHTSNGGVTSSAGPSSSTATARSQNQTVVVQNPMSLDESGKLVVYEVYDVYYELSTSKLVVSSDCISYEYSDDEPYEGSLSACQQSDEAHEYDGSVDDMMVQEIMISMVMRITTSETNVRCYHNPKIKSHDDTCRGKPITQTDMK